MSLGIRQIGNGIAGLINTPSGEPIRSVVLPLARAILRQAWSIPLLTRYISARLQPLSPIKPHAKLRLLVLNEERYPADLAELGRHPDVELLSLPSPLQGMINAIWLSDVRDLIAADPQGYIATTNPTILAARAGLDQWLRKFIKSLGRLRSIDGITSCTFWYKQDREWETAGRAVGVPFFALHKENMKDPNIISMITERYRSKQLKFNGDRLFLFNALEQRVALGADVVDSDRISIVGGLRMDSISRMVSAGVPAPKNQVTLFSFHHCVGLLHLPEAAGYFNKHRNAGFIDYFDQVHARMAMFAAKRPDVTVFIKPKWTNRWVDEIKDAIRRVAKLEPDDLPNLIIDADTPAQELMLASRVVVAINSTTMFESMLFGRPVVMPFFAEASDRYPHHVYFEKYRDKAFNIARSPEALSQAIENEYECRVPPRTLPPDMIYDYLGYVDGRVADRVVNVMLQDVAASKKRRGW